LRFKKLFNVPLVVQFYGADLYRHGRNPYYWFQYRQLFKTADRFLVCSEKMKQDLIAYGCPESKVTRLYLGIDLEKFPASIDPKWHWQDAGMHRQDAGMHRQDACATGTPSSGSSTLRFLMCGRLTEKKGFIYGLRALAKIDPTRWALRIIGEGEMKSGLVQEVERSGLSSRVHFLGNVGYSEYLKELRETDLLLVPSITASNGDREGLPMVVLEGLASGVLVIASAHSGIPEVVREGHSGFLFPEKDVETLKEKIELMMENPDLWDRLRRHGRQIVEKEFDLRQQVQKLESIYDDLLSIKQVESIPPRVL
jgi:colanic acid/amylovoran biosynthesis glycosyltransferase